MTRISPIEFLSGAAALPLVALAVDGCGGSGTSTGSAAATTTHGSATVEVANSSLGKILVDSKGRTLYLFKKDSGTKSTCFGACATSWPPERVTTRPTVGSGLTASKAATTMRSDGKPEITYNGHPLYLFAGDQKPGDTSGQAVNAFGGVGSRCPRRGLRSPATDPPQPAPGATSSIASTTTTTRLSSSH